MRKNDKPVESDSNLDGVDWKALYDSLTESYDAKTRMFDEFRESVDRTILSKEKNIRDSLLKDIFAIKDDVNRLGKAVKDHPDNTQQVGDGISLIYRQFDDFFHKSGVHPIVPQPGVMFDPHEHEALAVLSSDKFSKDAIIELTQVGYMSDTGILRAAQVIVSGGPG